MNIIDIGERRVFFMVVNDGNGPVEVPIDKVTYDALGYLRDHATMAETVRSHAPATPQQQSTMAELMEQLDHGATAEAIRREEGPPQPLLEVPSDLKDKLRSLGFGDEPDPGEILETAGDEIDGDQL